MSTFKPILPLLALLLIVGCAKSQDQPEQNVETGTEASKTTLDGTAFVIETQTAGSDEAGTDTLEFDAEKAHSYGCDQWGFGDGDYTMTEADGTVEFSATCVSDTEGKLEWTGRVEGDQIRGSYLWTKKGQDPISYTYEGTRM